MRNYVVVVLSVVLSVLVLVSRLGGMGADPLAEAEWNLTNALQSKDTEKINKFIKEISDTNNKKAVQILTKYILNYAAQPSGYEYYWLFLNGLTYFTDPEALAELADFILRNQSASGGPSADVLFVLKPNHSDNIIKLLETILEKGQPELYPQVVYHLGEIRSVKSVAALVKFLNTAKLAEPLKKQVATSLVGLTDKNLGTEGVAWDKWLRENKDKEVISQPAEKGSVTGTAADHLDYVRIISYGRLKSLPKEKVIVVVSDCKGCEKSGRLKPGETHDFDHIQLILERMNIPYTIVKKSEFDTEAYKLDDKLVVLFNCNMIREHCVCPNCKPGGDPTMRLWKCTGCDKHIPYTNILSNKAISKIREFVGKGGYVFSEDWILEEVLERAFPTLVNHTKYYEEKEVSIFPAPATSIHPYLRGVFEKPKSEDEKTSPAEAGTTEGGTTAVQPIRPKQLKVGQGQWHIDKDSPDIRILKPAEVTVLMVAPALRGEKGGKESDVVAFTFAYSQGSATRISITGGDTALPQIISGGRVLHVLSHFGKQKNAADEFVLQNLLLNFLIEVRERFGTVKK